MRWMIMLGMLMVGRTAASAPLPADCLTAPPSGPILPLSIDIGGRNGAPSGVSGQAYVGVPMETPGIACAIQPPPIDVLRGERGNLLNPAPQ